MSRKSRPKGEGPQSGQGRKAPLYRCQKCHVEWIGPPGPSPCFMCGSLYVDWLNYEADFAR